MRNRVTILLVFLGSGMSSAHDLFLKLDTYILTPHTRARVRVFNGTFQRSDAAVARDRVQDLSLLMPAGRIPLSRESWREEGALSVFDLQTQDEGTYVLGVALRPREIELRADQFNAYLEHDGIPDILELRRQRNELHEDVRERYSKYAKILFQVGARRTETFRHPLGYPVEIIPLHNPYDLRVGSVLAVRCVKEGRPLPNQFVLAGWETPEDAPAQLSARTDAQGIARFELKRAGPWYIKFIHMVPREGSPVHYESWWATLTFEVRE